MYYSSEMLDSNLDFRFMLVGSCLPWRALLLMNAGRVNSPIYCMAKFESKIIRFTCDSLFGRIYGLSITEVQISQISEFFISLWKALIDIPNQANPRGGSNSSNRKNHQYVAVFDSIKFPTVSRISYDTRSCTCTCATCLPKKINKKKTKEKKNYICFLLLPNHNKP